MGYLDKECQYSQHGGYILDFIPWSLSSAFFFVGFLSLFFIAIVCPCHLAEIGMLPVHGVDEYNKAY